jgi:hypothetical protein
MSQNNKKRDRSATGSWDHLREPSPQPEGPPKPWPEDVNRAADEFVDFLQNSEGKKAVKDFLVDAYKRFELEKLNQIRSRAENEKKVNRRGSTEFYDPGNIATAMHEDFNMGDVESAFVRGLKGTKANLVRSVEERVDDINRLLADIGGFSAQLKSCFARSTVVFLEQEDPKHNFRERLIFSINLPDYELKRSWDKGEFNRKKSAKTSDGRTAVQMTWDEAVNALAKIVERTGLKPKFCKNDRHYGRFVMKQDLRSKVNMPDEYFSFTLDYNTQEKIDDMSIVYNKIVDDYEERIKKLAARMKGYSEDSRSATFLALKKKHLYLTQERDFFIGTTPDPNQLDEGLLFLIEVSTLKDYHIVKDRMQSIMTRYILYLSKIAEKEAKMDDDLKYHLSPKVEKSKKRPEMSKSESEEIAVDDLTQVPQYTVDTSFLKNASRNGPEAISKNRGQKKKKAA